MGSVSHDIRTGNRLLLAIHFHVTSEFAAVAADPSVKEIKTSKHKKNKKHHPLKDEHR